MFWTPPSNNQINSNTNPYRSLTTEQLRQNAQKMWQEASEKRLKDQYTWDAKTGKYVRIDGKKTKFDDLADQYTWDEKTGKYVRLDGQTGIVAESINLEEGGVKDALADYLYSIPKAAIEELRPVMKIKSLTKRFAMITKVLKKHGFNDKFMGSFPSNVVNDYYDTFFGESAELGEAHAKDIVKGITDMDGPFTVVAIKNNKVIKQKDTKMRDALPAIVKTMRKEVGSGVTISIEGKKGILNTFKEDSAELGESHLGPEYNYLGKDKKFGREFYEKGGQLFVTKGTGKFVQNLGSVEIKSNQKMMKGLVKEKVDIDEVSPPGWEGTVKAMKKKKEIDNPWALAWWMKGKGYKSHRKADGTKKESVELDEKHYRKADPSEPIMIPPKWVYDELFKTLKQKKVLFNQLKAEEALEQVYLSSMDKKRSMGDLLDAAMKRYADIVGITIRESESVSVEEARESFPSENDLKVWYKETGAVSPFEGAVPTYKNLKNMWKRAKTQAGEAWKIWEKLVKKGTVSESVSVQEAKTASSTMVNSAIKAVMKNLHDMAKKPNRDYERIADAIENWLKKKTRANFDGAVKLVVPYVEDVIEELEFDNYMMFTDDQIVDIAEIVVERHAKHMGESNECGCGQDLQERSIADLAAEMIPVKFRAPSNKPKKVTAIKLVLPDNKDIRQKMKNVMDKDASYRRKMFELVIDREERDNGELVLYFASFRGRENFSKMMNAA